MVDLYFAATSWKGCRIKYMAEVSKRDLLITVENLFCASASSFSQLSNFGTKEAPSLQGYGYLRAAEKERGKGGGGEGVLLAPAASTSTPPTLLSVCSELVTVGRGSERLTTGTPVVPPPPPPPYARSAPGPDPFA